MDAQLPAETRLGGVTLTTENLDRLTEFYQNALGMQIQKRDGARVSLGTPDGATLLTLVGDDHARPAPGFTTGLYHFAILLPTRGDLARMFAHMVVARVPFTGFSDHAVSEALYLNDPDGNGIEIYRDRPRDQWPWRNGAVHMTVDPLDVDALLTEGTADPVPWTGLVPGTTLGHLHLRVSDLAVAERFYHDLLGFDITTRFPGALFVSAGGYHHHLGLNTWQSRQAPPPPPGASGLAEFTIHVPTSGDLATIQTRLQDSRWPVTAQDDTLRLHDPFGNALRIQVITGETP